MCRTRTVANTDGKGNEMLMLLKGNCIELLATLPDNSVDSIVTDPPYGLSFMGKSWDGPAGMLGQIATGDEKRGAYAYGGSHSRGYIDNDNLAFQAWTTEWAIQALRVLKPGGHLLAFGGSRTYHRLASAVEDAGFEIRDQIMWLYGSGFPKSHNLKDEWQGWGTALKPAHEPIVVARKPLIGTVATNVLTYGTGALNIDGSRVAHQSDADRASATPQGKVTVNKVGNMPDVENNGRKELSRPDTSLGRWPANVIHDGSEEVLEYFGEPQRFFYCAKASKSERNAGLEGFEPKRESDRPSDDKPDGDNPRNRTNTASQNFHPTVKPIALMRYLVKLVTPPNGTVLDPFLGSGTTAVAAILEGFNWMGCEMTEDYWPIIEARVAWAEAQPKTLI
jgi:DNA modification methylase